MLKQLTTLALFLFSTQKVNAQITTADSPAFNKDISFDASLSVNTTTTVRTNSVTTFNKCKCAYVTTVSTYNEKGIDKNGQGKLNLSIIPNTLVSLGYNKEYFGSISAKQGPVAASLGINTLGFTTASIALSPIKNTALYAVYNNAAMSYGIQQQLNNVALNFDYTPKYEAYSLGISVNIGSSARQIAKPEAEVEAKLLEVETKLAKPYTPPLKYAPWPQGTPVRARG